MMPPTLHARSEESPRVPADVGDLAVLVALGALVPLVAVLVSYPSFTAGVVLGTALSAVRPRR